MMQITAEKLRDYQMCRYLYLQKHVNERCEHTRRAERDLLPEKFDEALNKLIFFYFFERMNGQPISYNTLVTKWERIWFADMTTEDIRTGADSPGRNMNSYNTDAIGIIRKFWGRHERDRSEVLMLSEPYSLPIGTTAIASGFIPLVLRHDGADWLTYFTTRTKKSFQPGTLNFYQMVLDALAYTQRTGNVPRVEVNFLKQDGAAAFAISQNEARQVTELVEEMVTTTTFPAAVSTYWCEVCTFKSECKKW